jgi:hypothetical protein
MKPMPCTRPGFDMGHEIATPQYGRAISPGDRAVTSSWPPVSESPALLAMFGAHRATNPDIPEPRTNLGSLEHRDLSAKGVANTGFKDVAVHSVTKDWAVHSIEQFWNDLVKGGAPILMTTNSMPDDVRREKSRIALDYLHGSIGLNTKSLSAIALLGCGCK